MTRPFRRRREDSESRSERSDSLGSSDSESRSVRSDSDSLGSSDSASELHAAHGLLQARQDRLGLRGDLGRGCGYAGMRSMGRRRVEILGMRRFWLGQAPSRRPDLLEMD